MVLWVMISCRLVGGYKHFEGTHHLTPNMPVAVYTNQSHNPEINNMKDGSYSNALFTTSILELLGSNLVSGHKLSFMRFVVFFLSCQAISRTVPKVRLKLSSAPFQVHYSLITEHYTF